MNMLQSALGGGAIFPAPETLVDGLNFEAATRNVPGVPYTLADLLAHLAVTQRASLDLASGKTETWPEALDIWPGVPDAGSFAALLTDLRLGVAEARALAERPSERARELLTDLSAHNAYHWGQVALLRRLLGEWPQ
ncbi:DinB family protein [Deinococcus sp. S9]|uniref:DinB family protein n=1 Tax=Deinococcus sp. S9 TaxID=2545754 RepID=UPI001054FCF5|nr:DinB family protein [Deinococcus sp. S9]TDE87484.1 damage-inducible protein DinB [Deinococcus sp. S9]